MGVLVVVRAKEEHLFENTCDFVDPDLCAEFPFLKFYCGTYKMRYHCACINLQIILLRAANSHSNGCLQRDPFNFVTHPNSSRDQDYEIAYHIESLMEYRENPGTIYNNIKKFKEKCDSLKNGLSTVSSEIPTNLTFRASFNQSLVL
jgi:hypothetical protein